MRITALVILLAGVLGLMVGACGGDDEAAEEPTTTAETATEPQTTEAETETAETGTTETGEDAVSGEEVFASAGCGTCHTLEEAGTTGTIGPELDGRNLSADAVAEQVRTGGGGMPAFDDQLSDEEISAVAEFVADASR